MRLNASRRGGRQADADRLREALVQITMLEGLMEKRNKDGRYADQDAAKVLPSNTHTHTHAR